MSSMIETLKNKGYTVSSFATAAQAADYLNSVIDGVSVGIGGSMTVEQMGVYDRLQSHNTVHWHWKGGDLAKAAVADVYLSSVNALSETGEIINIDGIGNRVAAIVYGPKSVIVIAGMNKVCADLDSAIKRARTVAAPINHQRFGGETPCMVTGVCGDCKREDCICNQILITRHCRPAGRIKFIIVGESLGF